MQGSTQPPPRLTESSLIGLMERHGIGTDATVAEHINKQLERGYALSVPPKPTLLSCEQDAPLESIDARCLHECLLPIACDCTTPAHEIASQSGENG